MGTVVVLAALVTVVTALAVTGGATARAATINSIAPGSVLDVVTVSATPLARRIPRGYLGLSMEYNTVAAYEGPDREHVNPVLAQLIRNLAPGQTPILRIGGDSTDWTWWPISGVRRPLGASNSLQPKWLLRAKTLVQSSGARLIMGINLEANSTRIASAEARQLVGTIGRRYIEALEIGNEPQLYPKLPWYRTASGTKGFGRASSYSLADYTSEFARFGQVLPHLRLAGPSIGHSWVSQLGTFIRGAQRLGMVTFHAYAINSTGAAFRGRNCATAVTDPAHATAAALLAPFASEGLTRQFGPNIALAHSRGMTFRVDEMNAITCAGSPGVSDTFASALWALNALFVMANAGVDGVNIHTWRGSAGKLFGFSQTGGQWSASVRPLYYGLLLFAQAAPAGATLLPTRQSYGANVESWATTGPDQRVRVLLINHSLSSTQSVLVRVPMARGAGTLERLRAPGVGARSGLTLGGQSFGSTTTTGLLAGQVRETSLQLRAGAYSVRLPPATATLITASAAG